MRKLFSLSLIALITNISIAQKMTKDSLIVLMSNDVCLELNKLLVENRNNSTLETDLGLAMLPAFEKYMKEILQIYGFDKMSEENGGKVGEDIGMELGKNCPAFFKLLSRNPDATSDIINGKTSNSLSNTFAIEGSLEKIVNSDLSFVEVISSKGKIEKIYWFEYFEGSNLLIKEPQKLLHQKIKLNYFEREVYNSALKDYIKLKVIAGIQLN